MSFAGAQNLIVGSDIGGIQFMQELGMLGENWHR